MSTIGPGPKLLDPLRVRVARRLLEAGMRHKVFGIPEVVYRRSFVEPGPDGISPATRTELEDGPGYFERFEGHFVAADMKDRDVLDLGSGYGGRTIYYAVHGAPRTIVGLEISVDMADLSRRAAATLAPDAPISFLCGRGEILPFAGERFDYILTYDVLEHVEDLGAVLAECRRTLKPGGRLLALFPPYYGPRAHHLDYITTLPFLHHLFPGRVLVDAANQVIARHPELEREGDLRASPTGVLPTLNGTTERRFRLLVAGSGLEVERLDLMAFAWGPGGRGKRAVHRACRALMKLPWPFTRDVFTGSIRCILRKPRRS